ncbi:MAG: SPASM domain-containing protein [Caldisericia bacterium]|nr:SPASM domain-containing protein [Caldisericia bacterium]
MLYDTATGSLLVLDGETEKVAQKLEEEALFSDVPSSKAKEELNTFILDGTILSDIHFPKPQKLRPKSLCLIVSHACDMNCSYCSLAGVTGEDKLMKPEIAKQALEWVVDVSPGRKIDIDFFGGEPLLAWETVKETVLHVEELMSKKNKLIRWSLSTNCLNLDDEKIKFCLEHYVSLILSLDGPEEINDKFRKLKNGDGSFERLIPVIKKIASMWEQGFYVRGTYTRETINFSDSIISLHKMGISNLAFEPVVTTNPGLVFQKKDLETIRNEYEKLAKYYLECKRNDIPIRFYHFELNLDSGVCARKSAGGCGAGCEYLSVSPDSSIWSCHQLDGVSEHKMGELDNPPTDHQFDKFSEINHITNKLECPDCWASHLCAGGCIASNWLTNGNFETPYNIGCEIQKIRLEVALWIQSQLS